jgi:hypothetical protein
MVKELRPILPGRTDSTIHKALRNLRCTVGDMPLKPRWTKEEERLVMDAVKVKKQPSEITVLLPHRTEKKIHDRIRKWWHILANPTSEQGTEAEKLILQEDSMGGGRPTSATKPKQTSTSVTKTRPASTSKGEEPLATGINGHTPPQPPRAREREEK